MFLRLLPAALAAALSVAADRPDPPYSAMNIPVGSSWITHTGEWETSRVGNHGPANSSSPPDYTTSTGTISFMAPGTNVYWSGSANMTSTTTFEVYVDGVLWPTAINHASNPTLIEGWEYWWLNTSAVQYGWHNYTLRVVPSGGSTGVRQISLDTNGTGGYDTNVEPTYAKKDGWHTFANEDNWVIGDYDMSRPLWMATTNVTGETATFRPPKGTLHARIMGASVNEPTAAYTVTITPDPVTGPSVRSYERKDANGERKRPLIFADLDVSQQYEITLSNDGGGQIGFSEAKEAEKKRPIGPIIAGVVVPVLVLAAVGVGLFLWMRRRKARRQKELQAARAGHELSIVFNKDDLEEDGDTYAESRPLMAPEKPQAPPRGARGMLDL